MHDVSAPCFPGVTKKLCVKVVRKSSLQEKFSSCQQLLEMAAQIESIDLSHNAIHHFGMQAVEKFEKALKLEPKKHDALWCLGNAYTSQVRLDPSMAWLSFVKRLMQCIAKAGPVHV